MESNTTTQGVVTVAGEPTRATPPPFALPVNGQHERVVATPIRTVVVRLDGIYEGQQATMRSNPRRSVLRDLGSGDLDRFLPAIASLVVAWNIGDEDGNPLVPTLDTITDLPDDQLAQIIGKYFDAVREANAVPLASGGASATTSTTSDGSPTSGAA
jgi:hypothetical protein